MVNYVPMSNDDNVYRRQSSLGGNKIARSTTNTEGNVELRWGIVNQVYYRKGTCDFTLSGYTALDNNSGSDGSYSAPIPVDYYGTNYKGTPFIKPRMVQEGNKVLVAFVGGLSAMPVIIGVYPNDVEGYELVSPNTDNVITDNTEETQGKVLNQSTIDPASQIIYQSGMGDYAKSMQGHSFLVIQGDKSLGLEKVATAYENIDYFYALGDNPIQNKELVSSVNPKAPEWLLIHENNYSADGSLDKHRTRFYVNQEGELQIVFFDLDTPDELVVLEGNKTEGFTLLKQYDNGTINGDSDIYVKFNIGKDKQITLEASDKEDSKKQSQTLSVSGKGVFVNGQDITTIGGSGSNIDADTVKDIILDETGVTDWNAFTDSVKDAVKTANNAAEEAKKAGEQAQQAGEDAAQAGLNAQLAGQNASKQVDTLKNKLLYYLSISPEESVYVPGKYIILNEDVTVKQGFIKEGYIDNAVINTANIKDAAINSAKIANAAINSAKIANAAITNAKIANAAIQTANIANAAITDAKVGKLSFDHMIGATLDANLINVKNLTADSITAHTISADKLLIGNLGEISGNLGNITSGTIDAGQGNVTIDNLPADDPSMLTPEKKEQLRARVQVLQAQVNAQVDFQNSIGASSTTCDTLKRNMSKLVSDTNPLFRDMASTEEYDYQLINDDIQNVESELNNISNKAITTIGQTADGKNTIYTGAFAPENPKIGDIWAKPSTDGSNEGTFEIYGESGWFSPTMDVYNKVQAELDQQPKNYYQSNEPTGAITTNSMWYKTKIDALGNISFDMYVYQNGKWVAYNDSAIEGLNTKINQVAQTADGKNSVYSSATEPTNPHSNDIWIDTAHDNAIKVYINGQWTSPSGNTEQITNEINNAFSNVPSIYYQSTEPSGNIVEGSTWYKTGDNNTYVMYTYKDGKWVSLLDSNINSAVTDATNSINASVDNKINALDFGGRNLLLDSMVHQKAMWMVQYNPNHENNGTFLNSNIYKINSAWNGLKYDVTDLINRGLLVVGETYTFSVYVKVDSGVDISNSIYFYNADNTFTSGTVDLSKVNSDTFVQISATVKCNSNVAPASGKKQFGFETNKALSGYVYFAAPKFEKGAKATDYSIAPEDVNDSLNTNSSAINSVTGSVNTINNNINSINNQLSNAQSQLQGLTTVNYVTNSEFITNTNLGKAEVGKQPIDWYTSTEAYSKIPDWSGEPLGLYLDPQRTTDVDLTKDYAKNIHVGWIQNGGYNNRDTSTTEPSRYFYKFFRVHPGDTINISVNNVERVGTGVNYISQYDQDKKLVSDITVPGLNSSNITYNFSYIVPNDIYYIKLGFPLGKPGTHNTARVTYHFNNMYAETPNLLQNTSTIVTGNGSNGTWRNAGNGAGTRSVVSIADNKFGYTNAFDIKNTTNGDGSGYAQDVSLEAGKAYTFSCMVKSISGTPVIHFYSSQGEVSIGVSAEYRSSISSPINTNNQWTLYTRTFIARASGNQTMYLFNNSDNSEVQFAGMKLEEATADNNNLVVENTDFTNGTTGWNAGSTVSVTSDTLFGTKVVQLAPGGNSNNCLYQSNNSMLANQAYQLSFWAKGDNNTVLRAEDYYAKNGKDINMTTSWTYYSMPIEITSNITTLNEYLRFYFWNKSSSGNIKIANIKLSSYSPNRTINGYLQNGVPNFRISAFACTYGANGNRNTNVNIQGNSTSQVRYELTGRGHNLVVFDTKGNFIEKKAFDTYSSGCTDLVNYLNTLTDKVVAIVSYDACTIDSNFRTWLNNHGGNPTIGTFTQARTPHVFIGYTGGINLSYPAVEVVGTTGSSQGAGASTVNGYVVDGNMTNLSSFSLVSRRVIPGSYLVETTDSGSNANYMQFYDKYNKYLSTATWDGGNNIQKVIQVPDNAYYVRMGGYAGHTVNYWDKTYDVIPKVYSEIIPVATSNHNARIQSSLGLHYGQRVTPILEVGDNSELEFSTLNNYQSSDNHNFYVKNLFDENMGTSWTRYYRIVFIPYLNVSFTGEMFEVLNNPFLTVSTSDLSNVPNYTQSNVAQLLGQGSVQQNTSYKGVTISDTDGIIITSGNNQITLNANVGIDVWGNNQHNVSLDTNGNLVLRGNLVAGNISGVNIGGVTFTGDNMNLNNILNVNGAIKSNGVTIDSNGLHVTKGDITLGDTKGSVYTQLKSDGTLIAKNAVLSGSLTSNNVNITGGAINLVKSDGSVAFKVDSSGNATFSGNLSGVNIQGNNSTLSGTLAVNGTLSAANNNVILNNNGLTVNKGSINIGNGSGTTFMVNSDGTMLANNATITGALTATKLTIASNADVSINVNGKFTVDNQGNVYASSMTLENGTISGSNIYGSTLHLGHSYWNALYQENIYNTQYDGHGTRTGYSVKGIYEDINRYVNCLNVMTMWENNYGSRSYGVYNNNQYRDFATIDCSKFKNGDTVLLQMQINYDNAISQQGTTIMANVKGKDPETAPKYFGGGNVQQMNTGEYYYTWYFTYYSDLGNGTITLEHKVDRFFQGSRMYITTMESVLIPADQTDDGFYHLGYSKGEISIMSQMTSINGGSTFKQIYMGDYTRGTTTHDLSVSSAELGKGILKFNKQSGRFSNMTSSSYPYASLYLSGEGIAYIGDGHGSDEFAYNDDAIVSFWGSVSHESMLQNGGPRSTWATQNGSGMFMNKYGNIQMMPKANYWSVRNTAGTYITRIYNSGNWQLGIAATDNKEGIKFEANNGHITMGRLWLNTHGDGMSNNDVKFNLTGTGWEYHSNDISVPAVHTSSLRSLKTDISTVNNDDLLDCVLNTDIGKYHFKNMDYSTNSYRYTPIIEDTGLNEFSTDNLFIDDGGKTLNSQNMIGALFASVQALQKQISELNAKLLAYELKDLNK